MVNTTLIIEVIAIIFLLGIISYIAFVMFGPNNPTPGPGGKCWPGTQWKGAYQGCVTTPLTPVSKSECKNGVWKAITQGGTQGICVCEKPFFGPGCDIVCSDSVPCKGNNSCVNGKCTSKQCKCPDGQTCSNGGTKCDSCLSGRGPPGDCSKKLFTTAIKSFLPCRGTGSHKAYLDSQCQLYFGPGSTWSTYSGANHSKPNPCSDFIGIGKRRYVCNIPKYYADPSFDPSTWNLAKESIGMGKTKLVLPKGFEQY